MIWRDDWSFGAGDVGESLTITRPTDGHLHLRDGAGMADVVGHSARVFARAVVMPNLAPPIVTTGEAVAYRERILAALPPGSDFEPLMALYLTDATPPAEIRAAKASGAVVAANLYPAGATTHADRGVTDVGRIAPVLVTPESRAAAKRSPCTASSEWSMATYTCSLLWKWWYTAPSVSSASRATSEGTAKQMPWAPRGIATAMPTGAQSDYAARARALHKQVPLIDGHNDYPWALRERDVGGNFGKADITEPVPSLMTDIPRLRRGGLGAQIWSVYVPSEMQGKDAVRATLEQIDIVHRMTKRWPETFELALTADAAERAFKAGRIGSMIGMEGGHSIDSSMATLRQMYALGARYMTLTHFQNVPWPDSATDQPKHDGLSKFGEAVVREMNRLGMLVIMSRTGPIS